MLSSIVGLLKSTRPHQWTKNAFVFAAVVFAPKLGEPQAILRSFYAFGIFCLGAGAVYLINDLRDIEKDRLHPKKKERPIASGQVSTGTATVAALLLLVVSLGGSFLLAPAFGGIMAFYLAVNVLYSFYLKNEVILDVIIIAIGYVLRVEAGGIVIDVPVSNYLRLCTFLLALLLALGKRRHELVLVEDAANHRKILKEYSPELLDHMMGLTTASILVSYALYTQDPEGVGGQNQLIWTVPFVVYGIFRYLYLIHKREMGGDPAEILFQDWRMSLNILIWLAIAIALIYFHFPIKA
ncbi:MAG: decaprenyl-phosphate phosphoribosyltransferase [Candidatus Omnitrophica bacterium]|nr:decaprenyl-phosphate phosphoribosyltransferase [Candidatus Omnitrophota bacterium]MCA9414902.1 decaprenyl-phosphate phosphoribosyltransferase [Candidatus Omnitrophota bacterium]MCA9425650.1 decaprenyl-phosphate phosphoribosyltransferase [Candidatus Omnitrophota bacterium]MCA9429641.1 decaprenyl-phosphate phosphoribosyltransferase [Candidatus Omnitrophota bacterium]MCA9441382.1 decaprenyl-phosphate phosphoribosyltransferase [Candidatus Omnitrophota bacterium]